MNDLTTLSGLLVSHLAALNGGIPLSRKVRLQEKATLDIDGLDAQFAYPIRIDHEFLVCTSSHLSGILDTLSFAIAGGIFLHPPSYFAHRSFVLVS